MDLPEDVINKIAEKIPLPNDRVKFFATHPLTNFLPNTTSKANRRARLSTPASENSEDTIASLVNSMELDDELIDPPIRKTQVYARIAEKIKSKCGFIQNGNRLTLQLFRPVEYRAMMAQELLAGDTTMSSNDVQLKSNLLAKTLNVRMLDMNCMECYHAIFENWAMFPHIVSLQFESTWPLIKPTEADYLTEDDEENDEEDEGDDAQDHFDVLPREQKVAMRAQYREREAFYRANFHKTFGKAMYLPESSVRTISFIPNHVRIFNIFSDTAVRENNIQSLRILHELFVASYGLPVDPTTNTLSTPLRFVDFSEFRRGYHSSPTVSFDDDYIRAAYDVLSVIYASPLFRLNMREFRVSMHSGCPIEEPRFNSALEYVAYGHAHRNKTNYESVYLGLRSAQRLQTFVYDIDRLYLRKGADVGRCRKYFNYVFQGFLDNPDSKISSLGMVDVGGTLDVWPEHYYFDIATEMGLGDFRKGIMSDSSLLWKLTCLPKLNKFTFIIPYYSTAHAQVFGECLTRRRGNMEKQIWADPTNWREHARSFEIIDLRLSSSIRIGLEEHIDNALVLNETFHQLEDGVTSTIEKLAAFFFPSFANVTYLLDKNALHFGPTAPVDGDAGGSSDSDNSNGSAMNANIAFIRPYGLSSLSLVLPLRSNAAIKSVGRILVVTPALLKKLEIYTLNNPTGYTSWDDFTWRSHQCFTFVLRALKESYTSLERFLYAGFPFTLESGNQFRGYMTSPAASNLISMTLAEPHGPRQSIEPPFPTERVKNASQNIHSTFLLGFSDAVKLRNVNYNSAVHVGFGTSKLLGMEFQSLRQLLFQLWNKKRWNSVYRWSSINEALSAFSMIPAVIVD